MTPRRPARPSESTESARLQIGVYAAVAVLALATFAWKLDDVPFVDEYAYISQSYYADILLDGKLSDPAWLEFPAYDLVPLPKYLIGLALRAVGERRPGPEAARAWYVDTSSRFGPPRVLTVSRIPSVILAALGCVALAAIGAMAFELRVGALAAVLLMSNPLYSLHAHRAMSEAACEAFLLVSLALSLSAWKRDVGDAPSWHPRVWLPLAGAAAGLSVLAKFNGLLAFMTMAAWAFLAWAIPRGGRFGWLRYAAGVAASFAVACIVFIALDPFMIATNASPSNPEARRIAGLGPWQRFRLMVDHRRSMSAGQQESFPHNALTSFRERAKVVAVQGFGRFGPFGPAKSDSERRYDVAQDWGAFIWLPLGLAGLGYAGAFGRAQFRRREAPAAWAVAAWALVALSVVGAYLPMAWDRYQLPFQAPFALLASAVVIAAWDGLGWFAGLRPRVEPS